MFVKYFKLCKQDKFNPSGLLPGKKNLFSKINKTGKKTYSGHVYK